MIFVGWMGRNGIGGVTLFDHNLDAIGESDAVEGLLYLAVHPSGRFLYGVCGTDGALAHAWRVDGARLVRLGPPGGAGGTEPCHAVVEPGGRHLLVANYGASGVPGSVAALAIASDGSLGPATVVNRTTSPGPDRDRQAESHVHHVVPAPGGEVLVVDLGADEVVSYLLQAGKLVNPVASAVPAGSGPRNLVLLGNGTAAVSGELGSVLMLARHVDRRLLDWRVVPASDAALVSNVRNYPSDLASDGKVVYLANRGADSISEISLSDGALLSQTSCGAWPRQLALDSGRLFVSATGADLVQVFGVPGMELIASIPLPQPMCVVLWREFG